MRASATCSAPPTGHSTPTCVRGPVLTPQTAHDSVSGAIFSTNQHAARSILNPQAPTVGGGKTSTWRGAPHGASRGPPPQPQRPAGADCVCAPLDAARLATRRRVAWRHPHRTGRAAEAAGGAPKGAPRPAHGAPPASHLPAGPDPDATPTLPRDCWHWRAADTPQPGACACASTPPVGFLCVSPWLAWSCAPPPPRHPAEVSVGRLGEGPARGRHAVLSVAATPTTHARPAACATLPPARRTHTYCLARGHLPARAAWCWTPLSVPPPRDLRAPRVRCSVSPTALCHPARGCAIRGLAGPPSPAPPRPRPRLCRTEARAAAAGAGGARRTPPSRTTVGVAPAQGGAGARQTHRLLRAVWLADRPSRPVECVRSCQARRRRFSPNRSLAGRRLDRRELLLPPSRRGLGKVDGWAEVAAAACRWRLIHLGGGFSTRVTTQVVLSAHVRYIPRLDTAGVGRAHFVGVRARTGQGDVELGPDVDPTAAPFVAAAC